MDIAIHDFLPSYDFLPTYKLYDKETMGREWDATFRHTSMDIAIHGLGGAMVPPKLFYFIFI